MAYNEMLEKLGALKDAATVQRVFGEPQTMGEIMVIPVAEVRTGMGFGFGTGKGKKQGEEEQEGAGKAEGEGGGGGGAVMSRPVGVVEVTPEGTQFIPIKTPVMPGLFILVGIGLGVALCMMKSKCLLKHGGTDEGA